MWVGDGRELMGKRVGLDRVARELLVLRWRAEPDWYLVLGICRGNGRRVELSSARVLSVRDLDRRASLCWSTRARRRSHGNK